MSTRKPRRMLERRWWNQAQTCDGGLYFAHTGPGRSADLWITDTGVALDFEGSRADFPWTESSGARGFAGGGEVTDVPMAHHDRVAQVAFERLSSFGRGGGGGGGGGGGAGANGGVTAAMAAALIAAVITVLFALYATLTGGVALRVDRDGVHRAVDAARKADNGKRFGGEAEAPVFPLWAPRFGGLRGRSEADTLTALCDALSLRPDLRSRLAEPARTQQLLDDLHSWSGRAVQHKAGLRRRRFEVISAAGRLGYLHQNGGRPLPDEVLDPLDVVVDAVLDSIHRNPYAKYLSIGRTTVAAILAEHYVSVRPWPFTALTTDSGALQPPL